MSDGGILKRLGVGERGKEKEKEGERRAHLSGPNNTVLIIFNRSIN